MTYVNILLDNQFIAVITWILGVIALLGISLEVKKKGAYNLSTSLLITSFGTLNILYWMTFIHFVIGQVVIFLVGILCLLKNRDQLFSEKSSVLSLLCLSLWFACISIGNIAFSWDEFFWILFDQHISQFSNFWDTSSAILVTHIRYMPGSSVWHNFFGIKGHFQEATSFFANSILFMTLIYWLVDTARMKNRVFLTFALFIALGSFSEGWYTLYVDPFIGLLMGCSILAGFRFISGEQKSLLPFILSLSCSILFKETGMIPFLALVGTLFLALLCKANLKFKLKHLALGILYCFAILVSWKVYMKSIGANNLFQWRVFSDLSPEMVSHHINVWISFAKYITTNYALLAIWLLCFLIIRRIKKTDEPGQKVTFFALVIAGFLAIHVVAWMFFVGGTEGEGLAGGTRYMGSLLLAFFLVYACILSSQEDLTRKSKLLLVILLLWVPINLIRQNIKPSALFLLVTPHPKQIPLARRKVVDLKAKLPKEIYNFCKEKPTKIWFIHQHSNGFEAMLARHLLVPCQVSYGAWSLGPQPYYEGDIWTDNFTRALFLEWASNYPYLVTASIDEQFIKYYGQFFTKTPENGKLYSFDSNILKYVER